MTFSTYNVRDLGPHQRHAFEELLGQPLSDSQQVVLGVNTTSPPAKHAPSTDAPPWHGFYEGLSEAEIDELDAAIRQRCNFVASPEISFARGIYRTQPAS